LAALAERKRTTRTGCTVTQRPWWAYGRDRKHDGPAPHLRWPGVTIEIPAVWNRRRDHWESPDGKYYFDRDAADRACDFFPQLLRHHIGEFAGRPFDLLDYQVQLLTRPLFGWKRSADGLRRFRKLFGFLPKGAGKSPWAAGTGVYLARCDDEQAAEVYALANDRNQARTVHTNAKYMVEDQPLLSEGCEILKDSIFWADSRSTYQVLSSDASSAHGKRPHGLIFDELHGFVGDRDRELFEALKKSLIKRRQPMLIMISHSGTDDESLCHEEYEYAKGVLGQHMVDETHLPVLFEAQSGDDWTLPAVHARVNPGYGVTVKADAVENECLEALNDVRKRNDFLRYHLNRWVNQATAWLPVDWWDACDQPLPSDAELAMYGGAIGIDMAQKIDLTACVAVFRLPLLEPPRAEDSVEVVSVDEAGGVSKRRMSLNFRIAVLPAFWLPEETLREHVHQDRVSYDVWAEEQWREDEKLLYTTEGAVINEDAIIERVRDLLKRYPLLKQGQIGYDPAFATSIGTRLRDGMGLQATEVKQGYPLSEACQVFEALVKAKRVIHGGHKLLRWNMEHVAVKTDDAGRIKPVKPRRSGKRIDGVVATIMALSRIMVMPEPRGSVYKKRSALVWTPGGGFAPIAGETPNA
jgi:phage terminase large subunit-like protein